MLRFSSYLVLALSLMTGAAYANESSDTQAETQRQPSSSELARPIQAFPQPGDDTFGDANWTGSNTTDSNSIIIRVDIGEGPLDPITVDVE